MAESEVCWWLLRTIAVASCSPWECVVPAALQFRYDRQARRELFCKPWRHEGVFVDDCSVDAYTCKHKPKNIHAHMHTFTNTFIMWWVHEVMSLCICLMVCTYKNGYILEASQEDARISERTCHCTHAFLQYNLRSCWDANILQTSHGAATMHIFSNVPSYKWTFAI